MSSAGANGQAFCPKKISSAFEQENNNFKETVMRVDFSVTASADFPRSGFWTPAMAIALGMALSMYAIAGHAAAESGAPDVQKEPDVPKKLIHSSIEDLMNIEVTSVARKPQKLSESASAVYVITQEDIRRSGMSSIPELLRMVPGLSVAQFDANKWAISSRGFGDLYADKLLVLVDGRTMYSPLFSGVSWDVQDMPLEDIERIEVIRGSGGTLWGANAVNGVINIITKQAQDTQGGLASLSAGRLERDGETLRYGGKMGEAGYFRIYGKHFNRGNFVDAAGADAADKWKQRRGGFRMDLNPGGGDTLTLNGDTYSGESGGTAAGPLLVPPYAVAAPAVAQVDGGHLQAGWHRPLEPGSDLSLNFYYDHTNRQQVFQSEQAGEARDTYDIDFQHRFPWGASHELVWGSGYRQTTDKTSNTTFMTFIEPSKTLNLYSAFVQDESRWMENRLHFIAGSKFEHNDYTGFETQPNVGLLWKTGADGALWAAASRAVRTPTRGDTGVNISVQAFPTGAVPPVGLATVFANPDTGSEKLTAYEIGFRDKPRENFSYDLAAFYNDYSKLVTHETGTPYPDNTFSTLIVPIAPANMGHGRVYGAEASANWQAAERWRIKGSLSLLRMHLVADAGSTDTSLVSLEGSSPRQQWQLHSLLDLPYQLNLDAALYHVSELPAQGVPAYTRLDLRLGWQPRKDMELSVAAQNLTNSRHLEFAGSPIAQIGSQVPRAVYGKVTLKF